MVFFRASPRAKSWQAMACQELVDESPLGETWGLRLLEKWKRHPLSMISRLRNGEAIVDGWRLIKVACREKQTRENVLRQWVMTATSKLGGKVRLLVSIFRKPCL